MSANTDIQVIVRTPFKNHTGGPIMWDPEPDVLILTRALYLKAIHIWQSGRGQCALTYLFDRCRASSLFGQGRMIDSRLTEWHVQNFSDMIAARSPRIILNMELDDGVGGQHFRHAWAGDQADFDVRRHDLELNASNMDKAVAAMRAVRSSVNPADTLLLKERFHIAGFVVVNTFLHELGHIAVTYAGHGVLQSPRSTRELNPDLVLPPTAGNGEAGWFYEEMLFGGVVQNWCPDGDDVGVPCVRVGRDLAWEIDIASIIALMCGPIPQDARRYIVIPTRIGKRFAT